MSSTDAPALGTVEVIDDLAMVDRDQWSRLCGRAAAPLFYSYDFLDSVAQHPFTYGAQPFYLIACDRRGELQAALPVYLQHAVDPFAGAAAGSRMLTSHVWHCYDTRLLTAQPLTPAVVERFWDAFRALADDLSVHQYGLVNVALREPLARSLGKVGVRLEETAPRYRLSLTDPSLSLESHLAGVGRQSRRGLRKQVNRAVRAGARFTLRTGSRALDRKVLDLCLATADKHAPGYYPPDALAALVTGLGDGCRILRVELAGELLAASVCLYDRDRMHTWAGGCRYPDTLNWSPQYVLFHAELAAAFAHRPAVLECGRRNDEFKLRYGLTPYPLGRAVQRRPG